MDSHKVLITIFLWKWWKRDFAFSDNECIEFCLLWPRNDIQYQICYDIRYSLHPWIQDGRTAYKYYNVSLRRKLCIIKKHGRPKDEKKTRQTMVVSSFLFFLLSTFQTSTRKCYHSCLRLAMLKCEIMATVEVVAFFHTRWRHER